MTEETDAVEPVPQPRNIVVPPSQQGGVWSNFALVSHTEHEFTLDFVRWDSLGPNGIVVARVAMSPLMVTQLQEALTENWNQFAAKAMPKEVFDNDQQEPED